MFSLKILRSDTGALYEIPVNPSVMVGTIKESLVSVTNLQPNEQILLADTHLNSGKTLEAYNIVNSSLLPEEVNLSILDFQIPRLPTPKNLKELEASLNPLNKLFTLEFYLNNHVVGTQYLKELFENKVLQCINSLSELNIQKKSVGVALNTLEEYKNKLVQKYSSFIQVFRKQSHNFEGLLFSFDTDLNRLKQTKLHESLRGPNRKTLLDCVPELEIRKWSEQCKREFESLKSKISDLGQQIEIIKDTVDSEFRKPLDINFTELNDRLATSREHTKQFQVLHQTAQTNSEKIKKFLEMSRNSKDPGQLSTILMSFSEIKSSQENNFNASLKNAESLMSTLTSFSKSKNYMNHYVYSQLRIISKLQAKMHELINSFTLWNEALTKQSTNFFQLECIHHMPQAYEEALVETTKRRKFGGTVHGSLNRFLETLNGMREDENTRRQVFFEKVYLFLPPNVFLALKEQLAPFQLQLSPFDSNLPQISDIDTSSSLKKSDPVVDDDFALIDGFEQTTTKKPTSLPSSTGRPEYPSFTSDRSSSSHHHMERSNSGQSIDLSVHSKNMLLESQQREKIKTLESKLQSTFLLASKTEEKYNDLLEKSRVLQSDSVSTADQRKSQIEEISRELEEQRAMGAKLQSECTAAAKKIDMLETHEADISSKLREAEVDNTYKKKRVEELEQQVDDLVKTNDERRLRDLQEATELNEQLLAAQAEKRELETEIGELRTQIERHEHFIQISNTSTVESKELLDKQILEKVSIISNLESMTLDLEKEAKTSRTTIIELKDATSVLEREKRELESRLEEVHQKVELAEESLKRSAESHASEISVFETQIAQLNAEIQSHKESYTSKKTLADDLKAQLDALAKESVGSKTLLVKKDQEIQKLSNDILQLRDRIVALTDNNERVQKELEDANDSVKSNQTIITILQNQCTELVNTGKQSSEVQVREYEKTIKDLEKKVGLLTQEKTSLATRVQEVELSKQSTTDQTLKELDTAKRSMTQMREELDALRTKNSELDKMLESSNQSNQSLQDVIDTQTHEFTEEKEKLQSDHSVKLDQLNKAMQAISQSSAKLESTIMERDAVIANLKTSAQSSAKLESSIKEKDALIANLQSAALSSAQSSAKLESSIKEKDSIIANLQAAALSTSTLESTIKDKDLVITNLNKTIQEQKAIFKSLETTYENEQGTTDHFRNENQNLNNTLENALAEIEGYKEKLDSQAQKMTKLESQYDETNVNFGDTMHQLESLQTQLNERQSMCDTLTVEREEKEKLHMATHNDLLKMNKLVTQIGKILNLSSEGSVPAMVLKGVSNIRDNYMSLEASSEENSRIISELNQKLQSLENLNHEMLMSKDNEEVAQLSNFQHSRLAIFRYVKDNVYEAVNINSKHYYISPDCLDSFPEVAKKDIIIGTIIEMNKTNAEHGNPFGLPNGTEYHELLVGRLY
eukprot:gene1176-1352_t